MKKDVIDFKKNITETIELPDRLFGVKPNRDLLAQAVAVARNNQYGLLTGKTKTRAEVRGGGRKPWKQKGTGRARHGSIRSPIWVGGGMAHGPKPNRLLKMSRKMQQAALISALSMRNGEQALTLISGLETFSKTQELSKAFEGFGLPGKHLVIVAEKGVSLTRAASNLAWLSFIPARVVNTV